MKMLESHAAHAPLSATQTASVARFLHRLIRENRSQIEDLRQMSKECGDDLTSLRNKLQKTNGAVDTLRDNLGKTDQLLTTVRKDTNDNTESCKKLKEQVLNACDGIDSLFEGQKVTGAHMRSVREDLRLQEQQIRVLRYDVEKDLGDQVGGLKDRVRVGLMELQQLQVDHGQSKGLIMNNKTHLADHDALLTNARADLDSVTAKAGENATGLAETNKNLANTTRNLELTNSVVTKVFEDLENTMTKAIDLEAGLKSVIQKRNKLHEHHEKLSQDHKITHEHLHRLTAAHGDTRATLEHACSDVRNLQEGFQLQSQAMTDLNGELGRVAKQAAATHEGLKITNSYVLPNLGATEAVAPVHGGACHAAAESLRTTFISTAASDARKSPRKKKPDSPWISRNIGLVPDRMSWI